VQSCAPRPLFSVIAPSVVPPFTLSHRCYSAYMQNWAPAARFLPNCAIKRQNHPNSIATRTPASTTSILSSPTLHGSLALSHTTAMHARGRLSHASSVFVLGAKTTQALLTAMPVHLFTYHCYYHWARKHFVLLYFLYSTHLSVYIHYYTISLNVITWLVSNTAFKTPTTWTRTIWNSESCLTPLVSCPHQYKPTIWLQFSVFSVKYLDNVSNFSLEVLCQSLKKCWFSCDNTIFIIKIRDSYMPCTAMALSPKSEI